MHLKILFKLSFKKIAKLETEATLDRFLKSENLFASLEIS